MDRLSDLAARLRAAGCVAALEEARELLEVTDDDLVLDALVARRAAGEPLAWITGRTRFCDLDLVVRPGVYVPRWQSEPVARHAADLLPEAGVAVDLCCGSGAVAAVIAHLRRDARVLAVDIDPAAVACARENGVAAVVGDLTRAIDPAWRGGVDVVVAVAPYVPSRALDRLARTREPRRALDGGADGLDVVRRVIRDVEPWLRPGGHLVLEIGAPQLHAVTFELADAGFSHPVVLRDPDGDICGVAASTVPGLCGG